MPWVTPDSLGPEFTRIEGERDLINRTVPQGWADHFNLLTYGEAAARQSKGSPMYGVCGHGHVCLLAGFWRHPYPQTPICDRVPEHTHSGTF